MFLLNKATSLQWLADKLDLSFSGDRNKQIVGVASLNCATENVLTFSKGNNVSSDDAVYLAPVENMASNKLNSDNPRLDFIRALNLLNNEIGFMERGAGGDIHPSVQIGQNVVIEEGVSIGEGSVIGHNVTIMRNTSIGLDCNIGSNSSIGVDGFGYERDNDGNPLKFIHLGGVSIGDDVQIGANNTIARGALSNTIIENNVKTDNLVHIAHNCLIKQGAFLTAGAIFSGGVTFGKQSWIAPNASIMQKVDVGDNAFIGIGAVVTKNVPESSVVVGNPARILRKT